MANSVVIQNPFLGRTDGVKWQGNNYAVKDYANCVIAKKVNKLSKDDDSVFDVVEEIEITDIVDRQDYINQYQDEVGILNILKKVARTGDMSLLNQCKTGQGVDLTDMPEDFLQAKALYDEALAAYDQLPDKIKAGMTAEEFVNVTAEKLGGNIKDYVASLNNKESDSGSPVQEEGGNK